MGQVEDRRPLDARGSSHLAGTAQGEVSPATNSHATCHHKNYSLTCEQYEAMLSACDERCEICGLHASENAGGKLFIDHCGGVPGWMVRGLLCNRCNTTLGKRGHVPWDEATERYMRNPWYIRMLAEYGLPLDDWPEPDWSVRVLDPRHRVWMVRDGRWRTRDTRCRGRTWFEMIHAHGPHKLLVALPGEPFTPYMRADAPYSIPARRGARNATAGAG